MNTKLAICHILQLRNWEIPSSDCYNFFQKINTANVTSVTIGIEQEHWW